MFLLDDAVACYMMGQPAYKYETNDRASFTKIRLRRETIHPIIPNRAYLRLIGTNLLLRMAA